MIMIFPTDTVFGIGCKYDDIESINKIYDIKNRDYSKPFAILCSSVEQIKELVKVYNPIYEKHWPGSLTVVFEKSDNIPDILVSGLSTVAVRIPDCKITQDLINKYGPLCATSVNQSGQKELTNIEDIKRIYNDKVDLIIEDIKQCSDLASTVVTVNGKVLRQGATKIDV